MTDSLASIRKFIVAFIGALVTLVTQGFIEGDAAKLVAIIVIFATSFGVYVVPNTVNPTPMKDHLERNHNAPGQDDF